MALVKPDSESSVLMDPSIALPLVELSLNDCLRLNLINLPWPPAKVLDHLPLSVSYQRARWLAGTES